VRNNINWSKGLRLHARPKRNHSAAEVWRLKQVVSFVGVAAGPIIARTDFAYFFLSGASPRVVEFLGFRVAAGEKGFVERGAAILHRAPAT
jgi:hypothetical protein